MLLNQLLNGLMVAHALHNDHPVFSFGVFPPFPLSASISAIHHWMPVWSRKTVSAQCSPHLRISGSCPGFFGVVMLSGSTAHTCAPCGLPAVSEPPALVSLVRACGGASFAPTPRLLRASLPLRRYVRRVGVGTWPRGAVFPAFPVVHVCRLQKRNHSVNTKVADM